jgi:hypothetical protein
MRKLSGGFLSNVLEACFFCGVAWTQTDEQRAIRDRLTKHAALFQRYELKRRVEDMKPNGQGVIDLSPMIIVDYAMTVPPPTPTEELQTHARISDTVIQGIAEARYSALTPGHSYIYSDWVLKVTRIFKGSSLIPFKVGDRITVARSGGELMFNNQHVVAHDMTFPDFAIGKHYLLYLTADVATASFIAGPEGSVDVSGATPVFLLDPNDQVTNLRPFSSMSTADFLTQVERNIYR